MPPPIQKPSLSLVQREAKLSFIEGFDGYAGFRYAVGVIARERNEWAGIPMPIEGLSLVVEGKYPNAEGLMAIGREPEEPNEYTDAKIRNRFYSHKKGRAIIIWEKDGKIEWGTEPVVNHAKMQLDTLGASDAWGIEQEANAVQLLASLLRHRQFKQYMLTGSFLEASKLSGIHYMFRKLRPTLAISTHGKEPRILCGLCLHPIAYYSGSWAGGMCPTDDVIAHLMMMRADEHLLWRRANQHPPWRPECGL